MTSHFVRPVLAVLSVAVGIALVAAPDADAAKARRHARAAVVAHAGPGSGGQWGTNLVRPGPLYNGADYLGTDPDPNIRAFIIKDLSGRYGSSY